jgi:hypothetical protein
MTKKGLFTTITGIAGGILYLLIYVFKLFGWIDLETFKTMEKSLMIGLPILIALLAKDWNASHTKDEPPPELEEHDHKKKYYIHDHVLYNSKEWIAIKNNGPGEFNETDWVCIT